MPCRFAIAHNFLTGMICPIQLITCVIRIILVFGVIAFSKAATISSSSSIGNLKLVEKIIEDSIQECENLEKIIYTLK